MSEAFKETLDCRERSVSKAFRATRVYRVTWVRKAISVIRAIRATAAISESKVPKGLSVFREIKATSGRRGRAELQALRARSGRKVIKDRPRPPLR